MVGPAAGLRGLVPSLVLDRQHFSNELMGIVVKPGVVITVITA